ncbi:Ltp family lipoprotein [Amnibacterium kyonggiense]|uniref:Ltp family lipoprotein n=1 Tax=Amnibacterium kyonggiense TaxID=595671 RepID=UPI00319E7769
MKANWSREALGAARSYVRALNISKAGLSRQLTSKYGSQFTKKQAAYALRHVKVDYNKEALAAAKAYEKEFHMSDAELFDQLTSEYGSEFTASQAEYAIKHL